MKASIPQRIEPSPAQEAQEVLGMLSEMVSGLALRAARGDDNALEAIKLVRDEAHTLVADVRDATADGVSP
jgi:hypothetical protein